MSPTNGASLRPFSPLPVRQRRIRLWRERGEGDLLLKEAPLVSPTLFRWKDSRFFFFSREEERMHVHVTCPEGEAKFWLEPVVALAHHQRLNPRQLNEIQKVVEGHKDEIRKAWNKHFKG